MMSEGFPEAVEAELAQRDGAEPKISDVSL